MKALLLAVLLLVSGFSLGWLSKTWLTANSDQPKPAVRHHKPLQDIAPTTTQYRNVTPETAAISTENTADTLIARFEKWLKQRRYQDAMQLYQQQQQPTFKALLLEHLNTLLVSNNQNDFSELTSEYLSVYYDDIDVLLLLADFNRNNSAYMETINIYQLASTYAYKPTLQQKVQSHFNKFVKATDQFYSEQQDWFALGNLYAHIQASGLLTSAYQYRQAIVYLHRGDYANAIEQLQQLQNDAIVGTQATTTLQQLTTKPAETDTRWKNAETIALQQNGNQYLINLNLNQRDKVTLLIDTGASMTTLSRRAFDALDSNKQASKLGTRLFQTANGTTKGDIYRFPVLNMGPYQMDNIQIAVLDFSMQQGIDGLLGMNILGQYKFQIDQEKTHLLLEKK